MEIAEQIIVGGQGYELRGVVAHRGAQAGSGHYWAFVLKQCRGWYVCNDALIEKTTDPEPWKADLTWVKKINQLTYYFTKRRYENGRRRCMRRLLKDYQNIYHRKSGELVQSTAKHIASLVHKGEHMDAQEFLSGCLNHYDSDGSPLTCL